MSKPGAESFDPYAKETQLREESQSWVTSAVEDARTGDIPVIDLRAWLENPNPDTATAIADQLHDSCTTTGFFTIVGHEFPEHLLSDAFRQARRFHALTDEIKNSLEMDQPGVPVKGVGYLPYGNYVLPARANSNQNESFIIKRHDRLSLEDNLWPPEHVIPGFQEVVSRYAEHMESLARKLLPLFAMALKLEQNYFNKAFEAPLFRMRMTRYKPAPESLDDQYGIAPHVDTSFFTILAQDSPGLVVFSERRSCWITVPMLENSFIVNSGELLKQWSNDYFLSVKHYAANREGDRDRFAIPFFFNARPDYLMECLPSCKSPDNPPRYPPISYLSSQAVVQGE